jgi:hypothetical protein
MGNDLGVFFNDEREMSDPAKRSAPMIALSVPDLSAAFANAHSMMRLIWSPSLGVS